MTSGDASSVANNAGLNGNAGRLRIALLTPYTGTNLGDASIQDAMIANLCLRLPDVEFSGISLNCDNFVERHGTDAFPLLAHLQVRGTYQRSFEQPNENESFGATHICKSRGVRISEIKSALKSVPVLGQCLKVVRRIPKVLARIFREIRHSVEGYRFLRTQDLLIVCGGGQLNEEWGGAWQHPFGLFKWAVLAWIARVPYVVASVGAVKLTSTTSQMFVSAALRLACYRSYREKHTREVVTGLLPRAAADPVVSDLAFSLPSATIPPPAAIRAIAQCRTVIAISPIAYYKPEPGMWFSQNRALYERHVEKMVQVVSWELRECH